MTVAQGFVVALSIFVLGGGLWLCYIAIQISDADEAERRRGR